MVHLSYLLKIVRPIQDCTFYWVIVTLWFLQSNTAFVFSVFFQNYCLASMHQSWFLLFVVVVIVDVLFCFSFSFKSWSLVVLPPSDISFSYARIHIYNRDLYNSVNSTMFEINNQVQESHCPLHANLTVSNINPLHPSPSYHNETCFSSVPLITKPGENRDFVCLCFYFFITTKFLMLIQSEFFRIVFLFLNYSLIYIQPTDYDLLFLLPILILFYFLCFLS